ncbi:hypothetical protein Anapl_02505 [Anas platyrhynchos]|uniref:Uncharacterized protein n=1 Tax=Anas platyrhynchos TaxID=8839 RepID=R0JT91_ANAPL|nr:hypothetical protein Anapl_02505 [Anas platyrhynchos]
MKQLKAAQADWAVALLLLCASSYLDESGPDKKLFERDHGMFPCQQERRRGYEDLFISEKSGWSFPWPRELGSRKRSPNPVTERPRPSSAPPIQSKREAMHCQLHVMERHFTYQLHFKELNKKAVIVLQAINLRAITYVFGMCWQGIICNEKLLANQRCRSPLALPAPSSDRDSFSCVAVSSPMPSAVWELKSQEGAPPGSEVSLPTAAVTEGHLGVQQLHTDILAEGSFLQCSAKYLLGSLELVLVQGQLHILQAAPK